MRVPFVDAIKKVVAADPRTLFITGDLGYNAFEDLLPLAPRFLNAGVAEQNMIGVAAGAALAGLRPWAYSIAPFATYRCLEQIRNDVCLHALPVRIVGNGGGYTYGIMGSTHHALEELGVLKPLPNMSLFFPCSNNQVTAAVAAMNGLETPSYLRLAISGFPSDRAPDFENAVTLTRSYKKRNDPKAPGLTVIGAGHATQIILTALAGAGLDAENVDVFGLSRFPFDLRADAPLVESVRQTGRVLFVEEHYAAGGIGESLLLALSDVPLRFKLLAAEYRRDQLYGSSTFHLKQSGLTPSAITENARRMLRESI